MNEIALLYNYLIVGGADTLDVFERTFVVQTIGHGKVLGMVSDGYVFIAARLGSLGHLFDRAATVRFYGVHVDVATNVRLLQQMREFVLGGELDFTAAFAHLGRGTV